MSDERPQAEWQGRAFFAEVAEAVGVTTDLVMAVRGGVRGGAIVLFTLTAEVDADTWVYGVHVRRGLDGVLATTEQPRELFRWPDLVARIDAALEGEL